MLRRKSSSSSSTPDQAVQIQRASARSPLVKSSEKKNSFRPKRLIGRLVPFLLLTYVYHAYRLVVIEFGYKHRIQSRNDIISSTIYLSVAHLLFFVSLVTYLQIFFASNQLKSSGLRSKLGVGIPTSPFDPPPSLLQGPLLFQCSKDGSPIRCKRDSCNGKWKPPRSRHCGDCRECVPALDHHCPWFDSNVTAPKTMFPFIIFLVFVLLLYAWSFTPLIPMACRQTYAIWKFGKENQRVKELWWNHKLTWMGGPFFRWIAGWIIAGNLIPTKSSDSSKSLVVSSPNLRLPVTVFSGLILILVAGGLLVATLFQIKNGDLSVDVERRKAHSRLVADHPKVAKALLATDPPTDGSTLNLVEEKIRQKLLNLSSVLYFRINVGKETVVVATSEAERPYDLGWRDNFRVFLGYKLLNSRDFFVDDTRLYWPVNSKIEARLRKEALKISRERERRCID